MTEIALLILGVVLHWMGRLIEIKRDTGKAPNVLQAFRANRLHVLKTSILAIAVGIALYDMGQLNAATALFLGVSADRAADWLKRRAV